MPVAWRGERDDVGDEKRDAKPSNWRSRRLVLGRLLLVVMGLALGLLLSEIAIYVYVEWAIWSPYRRPPTYKVDEGGLRLAVLGGSTSNGGPYSDAQVVLRNRNSSAYPEDTGRNFNLLSITEYFLKSRFGYSDVEVDAYTYGGWPVEWAVKDYWQNAKYKPDIMVLYTGHNEWIGYYSSNMSPPPRALSFLGHLNTGSTLLRYLFTRQARPEDQYNYEGPFFNDEVLPWYEAEFNRSRFTRYVEILIQHCKAEDIFLIIVIPEGNYLNVPARSIYRGPADQRVRALSLFKQAFREKYFEGNLERAKAILEELNGFCGFTDLYFELGDIYHREGAFDKAREYLCKARDSAGMPTTITSEYRRVLQELAESNDVPYIDMNELVTEELGAEVPDFSIFLDDCHLRPHVYEALSRQIIGLLREHKYPKLDLPEKPLELGRDEWAAGMGLSDEVVAVGAVESNKYIMRQSYDTFLRLPGLQKCLEHYPETRADLTVATETAATRVPELKKRIASERERLRKWTQQ